MGWLKKAAQIALQVGTFVGGFGPLVSQMVPAAGPIVSGITGELNLLGGVIQNVELMGQALQLPGPQKLVAAAPMVSQIILGSTLMAHKKIADKAKFDAAVKGIASNLADLLNACDDDVQNVHDKA